MWGTGKRIINRYWESKCEVLGGGQGRDSGSGYGVAWMDLEYICRIDYGNLMKDRMWGMRRRVIFSFLV